MSTVSADIAVELECPACSSRETRPYALAQDVEYFTSAQQFSFEACSRCGTLFLVDPPVDQLAKIYPANYYSFQPAARGLGAAVKDFLDQRFFRRCLRSLPGESLRVMDVGGGAGHQLSLIRSLDTRIVKTEVVDLDASAKDLAQAAGHDFFHGRVEDFQPTVKFDLILALNLIEHVEDPFQVLAKFRDCLSENGMILIKTPNIDSLDHRLFRHKNWGGYHCPRHWVLFNRESFLAMAHRAGLRAKTFAYTQGAPFWAVSVLAAMRQKRLIKMNADRPSYQHPLYGPLTLLFAAFDFLRRPFMKTSQMFVTLVLS